MTRAAAVMVVMAMGLRVTCRTGGAAKLVGGGLGFFDGVVCCRGGDAGPVGTMSGV